jgi:hypothetical protein
MRVDPVRYLISPLIAASITRRPLPICPVPQEID